MCAEDEMFLTCAGRVVRIEGGIWRVLRFFIVVVLRAGLWILGDLERSRRCWGYTGKEGR